MKKIDIAVIDYGMGNLRSVSKALEHVAPDQTVVVTSNPEEVKLASRVVFPGQGAMPDCIRELDERGLREAVLDAARNKPFLGICIGLQMLFAHSEEGDVAGLGFYPGNIKQFAEADMIGEQGEKLKVPHMGWNKVFQNTAGDAPLHPLWAGIADGERFYYVHSYYVQPESTDLEVGYSLYPTHLRVQSQKIIFLLCNFIPKKVLMLGYSY
jgi:glutamine amidotransferase